MTAAVLFPVSGSRKFILSNRNKETLNGRARLVKDTSNCVDKRQKKLSRSISIGSIEWVNMSLTHYIYLGNECLLKLLLLFPE